MRTKVMILTTLVAVASVSALKAQQPQPADSAAVYARSCAACHGPKGTPRPGAAHSLKDFADTAAMASVTDSAMRQVIADGKPPAMPAYKARFTPEQINALVGYIRTLRPHP
jgi:mono/diheme cytochrome c family protein